MSLSYEPEFKIRYGSVNIVTNEILDADINIEMNTDFDGDRFTIRIYNIDALNEAFLKVGFPVEITLGYKLLSINIITGTITNIYDDNTMGETVKVIEGIDKSIYDLIHTPVNISINVPNDAIEIIRQIASQAGVVLSLDTLPS